MNRTSVATHFWIGLESRLDDIDGRRNAVGKGGTGSSRHKVPIVDRLEGPNGRRCLRRFCHHHRVWTTARRRRSRNNGQDHGGQEKGFVLPPLSMMHRQPFRSLFCLHFVAVFVVVVVVVAAIVGIVYNTIIVVEYYIIAIELLLSFSAINTKCHV